VVADAGDGADGVDAVAPNPWDVPFDWDEFVARWVDAVTTCDDAVLLRWAVLDCVTVRVGHDRIQSSRDGLVEVVHAVAAAHPDATYDWRIVTRTEHDAVVDWTRRDVDGRAVASGLWFVRVRPGVHMLELWRWHETAH
jgi:hypothetical protein